MRNSQALVLSDVPTVSQSGGGPYLPLGKAPLSDHVEEAGSFPVHSLRGINEPRLCLLCLPWAGSRSWPGSILTGRDTKQPEGDTQPRGKILPAHPLPGSGAPLGARLAYSTTPLLWEAKTSRLERTLPSKKEKVVHFF